MSSILPVVVSNVTLVVVLAVVVILVTRVWRSPQLAHALWALVLVKLITPPMVSISVPKGWLGAKSEVEAAATETVMLSAEEPVTGGNTSLPFPTDSQAASLRDNTAISAARLVPSEEAEANPIPAEVVEHDARPTIWEQSLALVINRRMSALGIIWCLGSVVYAVLLVRRFARFRRLLTASCEGPEYVRAAASRLAATLGLNRCPPLRVVDAPIPPLVWSLGIRPIVLLPEELLNELDAAQRDAVIAHELAHVRRRDDLVRWLEIAALVTFWWNPLAWFARRKLREAEEECCDAWVVWALPNERRSYGQAMLKTIEFLADRPVLPALAGSAFGDSFYKRRIEMIMKRNVHRKMSWSAFALIAFMALAVLPVAAKFGTDGEGVASSSDGVLTDSDASRRQASEFGNGEADASIDDKATADSEKSEGVAKRQSTDAKYEIVRLFQNPNSGAKVTLASIWTQEEENVLALKEWLSSHTDATPSDIAVWLNDWRAGVFSEDVTGPVSLDEVRKASPSGAQQVEVGQSAIAFADREIILVRPFGQPWRIQLHRLLKEREQSARTIDTVGSAKRKYFTQMKKRYAMAGQLDELREQAREGIISDLQVDEFAIIYQGQELKVEQAKLELVNAELKKRLHTPAPAVDLTNIDRSIVKEPAYQTRVPKYCLLVFGQQAQTHIWLVLDGDVLYVDRNGNGDLTEAGEAVKAKNKKFDAVILTANKGVAPQSRVEVVVGTLTFVYVHHQEHWQRAVVDRTGNLLFAETPRDAPVIHFNGPLTFAPRFEQPFERGGVTDLHMMVGTAGLGIGTFARVDHEKVATDIAPVAEIAFPAVGGTEEKVRVVLDQRC